MNVLFVKSFFAEVQKVKIAKANQSVKEKTTSYFQDVDTPI